MKILWFDTETTGLDPVKHDLWQLAAEVEVNGHVVEKFEIKCQPRSIANCSEQALEVGNITRDQLLKLPEPQVAFMQLEVFLGRFGSKARGSEKFYVGGYKVADFDSPFLQQFFRKAGSESYPTWFYWYPIDVYYLVLAAHAAAGVMLPKYKLVDVCAHYGITLTGAHDARYDIEATRKLFCLLRDLHFKPQNSTRSIAF
jgi:DNA polymerase III alpha subunit (gram-positive type)